MDIDTTTPGIHHDRSHPKQPWLVWIPCIGPESFDDDGKTVVGPFGESRWDTLDAAHAFLRRTVKDHPLVLAGFHVDHVNPKAEPPTPHEVYVTRVTSYRVMAHDEWEAEETALGGEGEEVDCETVKVEVVPVDT